MNVLGQKGRISVSDETRAIELFHAENPTLFIEHTRKSRGEDCAWDGYIYLRDARTGSKSGNPVAVSETKCRYDMDLSFFRRERGSWLILTLRKMLDGREEAMKLKIPYCVLVYIVPSDIVLFQKVSDETGKKVTKTKQAPSKTQATIDGGEAYRENRFVLFSDDDASNVGPRAYEWEKGMKGPPTAEQRQRLIGTRHFAAVMKQTHEEWVRDYEEARQHAVPR